MSSQSIINKSRSSLHYRKGLAWEQEALFKVIAQTVKLKMIRCMTYNLFVCQNTYFTFGSKTFTTWHASANCEFGPAGGWEKIIKYLKSIIIQSSLWDYRNKNTDNTCTASQMKTVPSLLWQIGLLQNLPIFECQVHSGFV